MKLYDQDIKEEKKHKNSYFLITYPFISLVPRKILNRNSKEKITIVYIDEAIKSGYSLAISDIYRDRILFLKGKKESKSSSDIAFVISDFIDYKNKIIDNRFINLKYKSICKISIDNKKLKATQTVPLTVKKGFDWKKFLESIENIDKEQIKNQAMTTINGEKRYDLVNNLADSKILFTISTYFAKELYNTIGFEKDKSYVIPLYAGSPEGNLLIDTMVFIFKILYSYNNIKFFLNGQKFNLEEIEENNILKMIFVDISIVSGATKNRVWNLDVNDSIRQKYIKFDYTFSIFNKNPNESDIYIFR